MSDQKLPAELTKGDMVKPEDFKPEDLVRNTEGLTPDFPEISMIHGGGVGFSSTAPLRPYPNRDPSSMFPEFLGVVLDRYEFRAEWAKAFDEGDAGNEPPECSSVFASGLGSKERTELEVPGRGKVPVFGACSSCYYNQIGSDPRNARRRKCREKDRVFVLTYGHDRPFVMVVPTTSRVMVANYMASLQSQGWPFHAVLTRFRTEKQKSRGGIEYSRLLMDLAVPVKVEFLRDVINPARDRWGEAMRKMGVAQPDEAEAPATPGPKVTEAVEV